MAQLAVDRIYQYSPIKLTIRVFEGSAGSGVLVPNNTDFTVPSTTQQVTLEADIVDTGAIQGGPATAKPYSYLWTFTELKGLGTTRLSNREVARPVFRVLNPGSEFRITVEVTTLYQRLVGAQIALLVAEA